MFKKIFAILALMVAIPVGVAAQANEVQVTAGVTGVTALNTFASEAQYRRDLSDRFQFKDTVSFARFDSNTNAITNTAVLKAFVTENIFVGGGVTVGKVSGFETTLNPNVEAGVAFDFGRVNVEPLVQLHTPDLLSDNTARSLGTSLRVKVAVNDKFGFVGTGGLNSVRNDYRFFNEGFENLQKSVSGGIYFRF